MALLNEKVVGTLISYLPSKNMNLHDVSLFASRADDKSQGASEVQPFPPLPFGEIYTSRNDSSVAFEAGSE